MDFLNEFSGITVAGEALPMATLQVKTHSPIQDPEPPEPWGPLFPVGGVWMVFRVGVVWRPAFLLPSQKAEVPRRLWR